MLAMLLRFRGIILGYILNRGEGRACAVEAMHCMASTAHARPQLPGQPTLVLVTCLVRIAASVATWCSERSVRT
jgi:hypothetical protein